jgi:hypothetical protein
LTTAVTAGWLLAALGSRSAARTLVVGEVPQAVQSWRGDTAGGPAAPAAADQSTPAEDPARFGVFNPLGRLALVIPDPDITGSLGPAARAGAAIEPAVPAMPLPRARPQLAALHPMPDLGDALRGDTGLHRTAVYDITARTVYLPSGERLEAHSGLGQFMDDPRHVHRRMRGATPPNVYALRLRERLFHGVQALRMTPVNEDRMFGRDGILAHSYLLGPSGQSNGCVSFKDYPRFLQAYLRGEIDRIVVVARLDRPPFSPGRSLARNTAMVAQ